MRILVAEDDHIMGHLMVTLLSRQGYACTLVYDGQSAVDATESDGFDLIFMDVQMPKLDGFKAARLIREREAVQGGHTPIVAITAHASVEDGNRCLDAGMDAYLFKPIIFEDLFSLIARYTKSSEKMADEDEGPD